jgi:hypothetical protein
MSLVLPPKPQLESVRRHIDIIIVVGLARHDTALRSSRSADMQDLVTFLLSAIAQSVK